MPILQIKNLSAFLVPQHFFYLFSQKGEELAVSSWFRGENNIFRAIVVASLVLSAFALATTTLTTTAPFSAYADQNRTYRSESGDVVCRHH